MRAELEVTALGVAEDFPEDAYEEEQTPPSEVTLKDVVAVYESAKDCDRYTQDENAWSEDVVRPALLWEDPGCYKVLSL